jgi:PPOX class probable F420-dependent enzyme
MDARTMRRLVATARVGHLGTVGADGRPHVVPVCFAVVDDVAYTAVDHKPKRSTALQRIANVTATGHACLLVDDYSEEWSRLWWVRLDGSGRVVDDPDEVARALVALRAKYHQYAERTPTGPVLAVDATRWSGWSASG